MLINKNKQLTLAQRQGLDFLIIQDSRYQKCELQLSQFQKQKLVNLLTSGQTKISMINNEVQKILNDKPYNSKQKLLGGGCSNNKVVEPKKLQKLKTVVAKQEVLHPDFKKKYEDYTNKKNIQRLVNQDAQFPMFFEISKFLSKYQMYISAKIDIYRLPVSKLLETCLTYLLSGFQEAQELIEEDDIQLKQTLGTFAQYISQNKKVFPSLDIEFQVNFLITIYRRDGIDDDETKGYLIEISKFMKILLESALEEGSLVTKLNQKEKDKSSFETIKELIQVVQNEGMRKNDAGFQERVLIATTYSLIIYIINIEVLKIEKFGNSYYNIPIEDEIQLLVEQYIELTNREISSDLILYLLTRINVLLEIGLKEQNDCEFARRVGEKIPISNQKVKEFIQRLQQATTQESVFDLFKQYLKLVCQNPIFRFLSVQILMKYLFILDTIEGTENDKDEIQAFLCNSLLNEKDDSVQIVYKSNQEFVKYVNRKIQKPENKAFTNQVNLYKPQSQIEEAK